MVIRFKTELKSAIVANPLLVSRETTVIEAIAQMARAQTSSMTSDKADGDGDYVHQEARSTCVLVIEQGRVIGLMTEREVVGFFTQINHVTPLANVTVGDVMRSPVIMHEDDFDDLFVAVKLLQQNHIRQVAVLDRSDRLLGIVTHESLMQLVQSLDVLLTQRELAIQRAIFDSADYSFISTDVNGTIQTFNAAAERMLGYEASEVIGIATPAIFHDRQEVIDRATSLSIELGQDIPVGFEVFVAKTRLGIVSEEEWTYIRKDGSRFPVLLSVTALKDHSEQIVGFLGIAKDISEQQAALRDRKQAELALKKSEQRYRDLMNNASDAIFQTSVQGKLIEANHSAETLLGYSQEELMKLPMSAIHPPEVLEMVENHFRQIVRSGVGTIVETLIVRKDGKQIPVEINPNIIDLDGEIVVQAIFRDLTDRKQAEAALRESERRFVRLAEAAPVAIFRYDTDKNCIYLNDRWSKMTGRPIADGLGYGWVEAIHPQDREWISAELAQWFPNCRAGDIYENEARILRPDGSIIWYMCQMLPETDSSGLTIGYVGSLTDISDRKQAEQEISEKQRFIQKIADSSPNILYLYDLQENRNVYCNREITTTLGYSPDEVKAMGESLFANLMHPDDFAKIPDYYRQIEAAQDGDIFEIEYRMRHANGEWRWLFSRDSVFSRDDRGHVKQTIGTAQDISDRKQSEITLQQTTALLEASNRELEAFAYSVSHDLRSPLRAIDGFSNALLEDYSDKFDDNAKDYFDRIRRNVQRMGMLIDDLLRLSRVSRSSMQYKSVNLSKLVRQQLQELQIIDSDRAVECIISDPAIVQADAALMAVVINNLCQNAWKFTSHHATAKIEFGVMRQEGAYGETIYFVRDDGAGFDMNYADKLFGVFQRLHNTNEFAGTGIGLATVQRAIHRHGGKVWAEAAVEQGATFYFTVPTARSN